MQEDECTNRVYTIEEARLAWAILVGPEKRLLLKRELNTEPRLILIHAFARLLHQLIIGIVLQQQTSLSVTTAL